jgi:low affinity Fe/Cu permease
MTFDRFSEMVTRAVTRPWFFAITVIAIAAWLPTMVMWDTGPSDLLVDALTNPLSLVLLILLHNSQYRSEQAKDDREDHLERSLALVLRHLAARDDAEQRRKLERAPDELVENAELTGV